MPIFLSHFELVSVDIIQIPTSSENREVPRLGAKT
jgi:hypothetical protein